MAPIGLSIGSGHKLYAPDAGPTSQSGYAPAQLLHAYGFDQLSLDGTGQTIAIVDAFYDPNIVSDLKTFDQQFGLPDPPSFSQVDEHGNPATSSIPRDPTGDWEVEESLDVEWAHAIAPKANILLVEANSQDTSDLLAAVDTARNAKGVVAVSLSWGGPESGSQTSFDSHLTTPTGHAGITFLASSGDSGTPAGWPATSPNVVGVGGTTLTLDASNNRIAETGWMGSGGSYSSVYSEPTYQSTYAKSTYVQTTLGNKVLLNSPRGAPDVSYDSDPSTGVAVYDSYPYEGAPLDWVRVGGTSAAAPQWAGLIALVDQGRGALGSLDGPSQTLPALYQLGANSTSYSNDFFDVTSGSNGKQAGAGYDLVTGLGSPKANNLIPDLIKTGVSTTFKVTTSTSTPTAGTPFSVTVTAQNAAGLTLTTYTGTVHFTTSDTGTGFALPANYTFTTGDNGTHTFTSGVTLVTAGSQTVTATDTSNSAITGQAAVTVSAAAASTLTLSAPISSTQGSAFSVTVTAKDAFGNIATGYTGVVHFTTSDTGTGVVLPADYTFLVADQGSHTFTNTVILVTPGSQTVTATDTVNSSLTSTATVNVQARQATHLSISAPSGATAGVAFSITVTALDANNNIATGYLGTIHFTSSDQRTGVALPADYTFTSGDNGAHTFTSGVTLVTAGSQTVTATDKSNSSITGQASVTVSAAAASTLTLSAPGTSTPGSAFSVTVTAKDAFGNIATGYTGVVHFTTSDTGTGVVLPSDYPFGTADKGSHIFTGVTLVTLGNQTVTATDTVNSSLTSTATVNVQATQATHLSISAPSGATAGVAFSITVTALDANNNIATGYLGTIHFTSSDQRTGVALPADYTFTSGDNGAHTFTSGVTLVTAGSQTVTATDTGNSSITGKATAIVNAAAASKLVVAGFPSPTAVGTAGTFTVTAQDAFGNTATGYTGTIAFGSSDGRAMLPFNSTLSNGTGTFSATFNTAGTQSLTATDTVSKSITGTQSGIQVIVASLPTITGMMINSGLTTGGYQIAISGTNLGGATAVYFGTTLALIEVDAPTYIDVLVPAHMAGTVDVTVVTPAGTSRITPADQFTYVTSRPQPPSVQGVSPNSGSTAGGFQVAVSGVNFTGATAVYFGSTLGTILSLSDTSISVIAPAHFAGTVDVTVVNLAGTSFVNPADHFTYLNSQLPAPTVQKVSPRNGSTNGGYQVVISGTNLGNATAVYFGNTAATILGTTATSIAVIVPAHAAGWVDVTVVTPAGTSGISEADMFAYQLSPSAVLGSDYTNALNAELPTWSRTTATQQQISYLVAEILTNGGATNFTSNFKKE